MLLSGPQEAAGAVKKAVAALRDLTVSLKEVRERRARDDVFEYSVRIVGEDHTGIVHEVSNYLKAGNVNVLSLDTSTGHAPHSGTQLFRMDMVVEVPKKANLKAFKAGLLDLCDRLNMDVDAEQAGV
jgi:glycine cleavage system transcriptional repressor